MRKHIYEYLYLTRQERNGLLVIMLTTILISVVPHLYGLFVKKETTDFTAFLKEIELFQNADETPQLLAFANSNFFKKNKSEKTNGFEKREIELFPFDPNLASKDDFIRLGISPKTAQTIINFRNKGAKFFRKEDLKKVYGVKNSDYERLKDFIQIKKTKSKFPPIAKKEIPKTYDTPTINHVAFDPNTANVNVLLKNGIPKHVANTIIKYRSSGAIFKTKEDLKKIYTLKEEVYAKIEPYIEIVPQEKKTIVKASIERKDFPKKEIEEKDLVIDVNKARPEDWQKLRGIGPSFSKRIVSYRDKLGGFHSIEQVGETYGLPDSTFQKIKIQLQSSAVYKKINLNQATEEQLKKHPYISWNQAKLIASYRKMHGAFKDVNELLEIGALKKEWLEKVKHYLIM